MSKNLTDLHNSVFEINAIEINIHAMKVTLNMFLIASPISKGLKYSTYILCRLINLLVESKNIFVLFLYHEFGAL